MAEYIPDTDEPQSDTQRINRFAFPAERLASGDTIQLVMRFFSPYSDNIVDRITEHYGVYVLDYGIISMEYDFHDRLLVPAQLDIEIADLQGTFEKLIFWKEGVSAPDGFNLEGEVDVMERDPEIEILINGSTEFIGRADDESMEYNPSDKTFKFTATPKLDILNQLRLYNDDGEPVKPEYYDTFEKYWKLTDVIHDIFKHVDTGVTLDFNHDWKFNCAKYVTTGWDFGGLVYDIDIDEIEVFLRLLYNNSDTGLTSIGDLLRKIAFDTCSYTGMKQSRKAFFKKLFKVGLDAQELTDLLEFRREYKYTRLQYAKFQLDEKVHSDTKEGAEVGEAASAKGRLNKQEDKFLDEKLILGFESKSGGTITSLYYDGLYGRYRTYSVNDPYFTSYYSSSAELHANFWMKFRGESEYCQVYFFKVYGINYEFDLGLKYNDEYFQIISMRKNFKDCTTEFEAVRVPAPNVTVEEPSEVLLSEELTPNTSSVPYNQMEDYVTTTVTEAVTGVSSAIVYNYDFFDVVESELVEVGSVQPGEIVESVTVRVDTAGDQSRILSLTVQDDMGNTFVNFNEVDYAQQGVYTTSVYESYGAESRLYFNINLAASGTQPQGSGKIIIKKIKVS